MRFSAHCRLAKMFRGMLTAMKNRLQLNPHWLLSAILGLATAMLFAQRLEGENAPRAASAAGLASTPNPSLLRNDPRSVDRLMQQAIENLELSGGTIAMEGTPSARIGRSMEVPLGRAPLLSFRSFDREDRYRLGKLDLVVDDAGH